VTYVGSGPEAAAEALERRRRETDLRCLPQQEIRLESHRRQYCSRATTATRELQTHTGQRLALSDTWRPCRGPWNSRGKDSTSLKLKPLGSAPLRRDWLPTAARSPSPRPCAPVLQLSDDSNPLSGDVLPRARFPNRKGMAVVQEGWRCASAASA